LLLLFLQLSAYIDYLSLLIHLAFFSEFFYCLIYFRWYT